MRAAVDAMSLASLIYVLDHQILGEKGVINSTALANFVARCQFKFGGIAKAPGEYPGA